MRFILLFSYIIPISLRVNLDMAKLFYAWQIGRDRHIRGKISYKELNYFSFNPFFKFIH